MPIRLPIALSAAMIVTMAAASPALAQNYFNPSGMTQTPPTSPPDDPVAAQLIKQGEIDNPPPDSELDPDAVRTTAALNAEIAAQNMLADNQDAADYAAYQAAQSRYQEEAAAAEAERLRYEAESQAAEAARLRYERDRADWAATVAACQRGDSVRCRAGSAARAYPDQPLPPGEPVG